MKKNRWIFFLGLSLFVSLSCGKKTAENDDGLIFTTSSKIILLDADIYSCDDIADNATEPSLKAISGKTSSVKIQWSGENTLEIQKADLVITGSAVEGGQATIKYSLENFVFPGSDPNTIHTVGCGFRFGGLKLIDKNKSANLKGVISMVGITTDSEDNTSVVKATLPVDLEYDP